MKVRIKKISGITVYEVVKTLKYFNGDDVYVVTGSDLEFAVMANMCDVVNEPEFPMSFEELPLSQSYFGGWPTQELCNAAGALAKLLFLRKAWIDIYSPKWEVAHREYYYGINNGFYIYKYGVEKGVHALSFPDQQIAEKFKDTFSELFQIAKPLL